MDSLYHPVDLAGNENCEKHSPQMVGMGTYPAGAKPTRFIHYTNDSIIMKSNYIIYADLSTYTPKETISFYEQVFGWVFYPEKNSYYAYLEEQPIIGLYETPEQFKKIQMPHFWMSYIQVNDAAKTVANARELGGIIEKEQDISGFGKVALIRDPQGAGFTIYEGEKLTPTRTDHQANTLIWNELHISNAQNIIPFYEGIFDWTFHQKEQQHFEIYNGEQQYIADALEISNEFKGKYEYWCCTFGVNNLPETKNKILENGGSIVIDEGERIMFADNSGQAFFYVQEVG